MTRIVAARPLTSAVLAAGGGTMMLMVAVKAVLELWL